MLKYFFILFLICIIYTKSYAQNIGCTVGTTNYTTLSSGTTYNKNGTKVTLGGACTWFYTAGTNSCTVSGGVGSGRKAWDMPQNCPIDDYAGLIVIAFGGLGFFFIKKRGLILLKIN